MTQHGVILSAILMALVALVGRQDAANAELKDFQVARLIMIDTQCILGGVLTRNENADGSWSYHGYCANETFYPDGIDIHCPDPDNNDERFCKVLTNRKVFRNLELLRRHGSD